MKFLNKMERKFGKYAISNISLMLIICYGFGYAIAAVNSGFLNYLTLNPYLVLHGQVWRLVTWIIVPPGPFGLLTLISLYFYYWLGTTLERTWGTFRYNLYLFSGMFFTALGSFVLLGYCYLVFAPDIAMAGGARIFFTQEIGYFFGSFSTYYVNLSIFLAFALTYPDMQVLLFFIIPVKIKWLAALYAVMIGIGFVQTSWTGRIMIVMSLMNFLIFFLSTRDYRRVSPSEIKRKRDFRAQTRPPQMRRADGALYKHKCAVCGRTDLDDTSLEFRFCSKCEGTYEYCQDHLFTHEHVKRS